MRRLLTGLAAIVCVVLLPAAALAQGSAFGGGSIAGIVKDTSGAVLPGVTVEAASPALIEKVRTTTTDGSGQYKILDLRPGIYTVTFTLTGFNTQRRDGFELAGVAVVTVNADLKVGAVEETVTVTGETPVVDLQTTTKERVMSKDVIDALPTSRLYYSLGVLVPGVSASTRDVGGAGGSQFNTTLTAHGSTGGDQRVMINGLNLGAIHVGNISNVIPNTGAAQEVQIDTAAASAERQTGGVTVNFLPKDGGNTLRGTVFATGATENQQASNFTQSLADQGATVSPNKYKETWDFNPGIGGPILKDKVWFYYAFRAQGSQVRTDMFYNQNEFLPDVWTYVANPNRPALSQHAIWKDNNLRVTWQMNAKNKLAGTFSDQTKCGCPDQISSTQAPEAAREDRNPLQRTLQAEWWSPLTSKFLVEVVTQARGVRQGFMDLRPTSDGGSLTVTPAQYALYPSMIGVTQTNGGGILPNGLSFHGPNSTFNTSFRPAYAYRAAVSYVTGAHAFKVGLQDTFGYATTVTYLPTLDTQGRPVRYRFASANTPDQVTIFNTPTFTKDDQNHDLGLFAQDRWTRDRLTLNLGVRYDWYSSSYPAQTLLATSTGRPQTDFAAGDSLNWKDVTPRMGAAYDLQGDGKTAVKLSLNKYLVNQALGGIGTSANPLGSARGIVQSWTRNWDDNPNDATPLRGNGNFIVDCDVNLAAINGECTNAIAGSVLNTTPGPVLDSDIRNGWGLRGYDWEFSAGVQRELLPRVSIEVSYFRRWYGNFTATDNTACVNTVAQTGCVVPGNFKSFDVITPVDTRLPGGGGNVLTGFVDPDCTGAQANCGAGTAAQIAALTALNKTVISDKIGANQIDHWNGVDVNISARLQNGLLLQGGTSTGRRYTNNCEVSALLPETLGNNPQSFCEVTEPWLTQVKAIATYTLPQYASLPPTVGRVVKDFQIAGTFQSIPGGAMSATYAMTNTEFATACPSATADTSCSTLGRFISNQTLATNTKTVSLVAPGTLYDERENELDLRVSRILRFGRTRTLLSFDVFNVFNSNTILGRNNTFAKSATPGSYAAAQAQQADLKYHTLWVPSSVLQARFYKFSVSVDF